MASRAKPKRKGGKVPFVETFKISVRFRLKYRAYTPILWIYGYAAVSIEENLSWLSG
jgi:hypothetical protein